MPLCQTISCHCGDVTLELTGKHIISVECMCTSCREAGLLFKALDESANILDSKDATSFVLFRKDRVHCLAGADKIKEFRLRPESKTRRLIATCCNTPMFLEFTQGHWLSLYGKIFRADQLPPPELRTMTVDLPPEHSLPDDIPNPKSHTFRFVWKLIFAWAAMGFRTPKITYVNGTLELPDR